MGTGTGGLRLRLSRREFAVLDLGDGRRVEIRLGYSNGPAGVRFDQIRVVAPDSVRISREKDPPPGEVNRRRDWRIDNREGERDGQG